MLLSMTFVKPERFDDTPPISVNQTPISTTPTPPRSSAKYGSIFENETRSRHTTYQIASSTSNLDCSAIFILHVCVSRDMTYTKAKTSSQRLWGYPFVSAATTSFSCRATSLELLSSFQGHDGPHVLHCVFWHYIITERRAYQQQQGYGNSRTVADGTLRSSFSGHLIIHLAYKLWS